MHRSTEYVSHDILNDDLLKIFSPFHRFQTFLGVCRVDIRNKFVTPLSTTQKVYTCGYFIVTPIFLFFMLHIYLNIYSSSLNLLKTLQCLVLLQWAIFMLNVFNVRFVSNEDNVNLFLQMHQVDRLIKIDKNKSIISIIYKMNRNTILVLILTLSVLSVLVLFNDFLLVVSYLGIGYVQLTYMLEFLHFSCIVYHFSIRIEFLNAIIMNHLKPEFMLINFMDALTMPSSMLLRKLAADTHDFADCDIDIYFKKLIYCFYKFQDLYKYQILIFFLKMFFCAIFYMHFIIVALKDNSLLLTDTYMMITLSLIDSVLISLACTRCEKFFRETKLTKRLSISVLSIYYDGPLRGKAKRILKILEENPPLFSVYNMWNLKSSTMVQITGVLTTMFFTVLQFHYL